MVLHFLLELTEHTDESQLMIAYFARGCQTDSLKSAAEHTPGSTSHPRRASGDTVRKRYWPAEVVVFSF